MTLDRAQPWLFLGIVALLVCALVMHLAKRNSNRNSRFSFDALLVDPKTRETSPARVVLMGTFLIASAVVVYGAFIRSLSDAIFLAYCATFAAPAVVKIITDAGVEKAANTPAPGDTFVDRQITIPPSENATKA